MALSLADELAGVEESLGRPYDEFQIGAPAKETLGAELAQALEADIFEQDLRARERLRPSPASPGSPRRTPVRRRSRGARTAKSTPESYVTAPTHLERDSSVLGSTGSPSPLSRFSPDGSSLGLGVSASQLGAIPSDIPARLFSPAMEREALDELLDILNSNGMFLSLLEMTIDPPFVRPMIGERIQNHLDVLQQAEKTRDREIEALETMDARFGQIDWDLTAAEEMHRLLDDVLQEVREEWLTRPTGAVGLVEEYEYEVDDPFVTMPTSATSASPTSTSPLRPMLRATEDLISSFAPLTAALHESHSLSIPIARQVRAIRAAVESFKAREAHEAACRSAIDEWETKRVQRGLRGELGYKERLEQECREFAEVLDGYGEKLRQSVRAVRTF